MLGETGTNAEDGEGEWWLKNLRTEVGVSGHSASEQEKIKRRRAVSKEKICKKISINK